MRECIEPIVGRLLGAYEFGLLPDAEQLTFEIHLLECFACALDVFEMAAVIEVLMSEGVSGARKKTLRAGE